MLECMDTCEKLSQARTPPSTTEDQLEEMRELHIKFTKFPGSPYGAIWLSMTDAEEEGVWRDHYTGQEVSREVEELEVGGLKDNTEVNCGFVS